MARVWPIATLVALRAFITDNVAGIHDLRLNGAACAGGAGTAAGAAKCCAVQPERCLLLRDRHAQCVPDSTPDFVQSSMEGMCQHESPG